MAEMCPLLNETQLQLLGSRAEARFYRACQAQLPPGILVVHSLPFLTTATSNKPLDGEIDFIVFDERRGVLVIEVKGGGVSFNPITNKWYSIDGSGVQHDIKDPFAQAVKEKYAVLDQLNREPKWRALGLNKVVVGHAVLLADLDNVGAIHLSNAPREILGGRPDLADVRKWLTRVFDYWEGNDVSIVSLGNNGLTLVRHLFCDPIDVRPLLSADIAAEEIVRIRLTQQQTRILRDLRRYDRLAICGGAGTGKTLLAMEKARTLANTGLNTLLVCYNRPLADSLKIVAGTHANLSVLSFHQLCEWRARRVLQTRGIDLMHEAALAYPEKDRFHVQYPMALARSTELLPDHYDAIIVDEGQDFRDDYWLPLELLLCDIDRSPLYVFYDDNQCVYQCASTFPIKAPPINLTVNCRNTRVIHEAAYRFFRGTVTDPPEISGQPIGRITANDIHEQSSRIHSLVSALLTKEKVPAELITVLIAGQPKSTFEQLLSQRHLPASYDWSIGLHGIPHRVLVETVRRFKGLESSVVILWAIDEMEHIAHREIFYVGLSRAKSRLFIVGKEQTCSRLSSFAPDLTTILPTVSDAADADVI